MSDGIGCICGAYCEQDCSCTENKRLQAENEELREDLQNYKYTTISAQNYMLKAFEERDALKEERASYEAHLAAMTKDMDSLEKQLEMADAAIEKWREENEELRKAEILLAVRTEELAALKAELAKVKAENDELRALIIETKNEETEDATWERINTIVFNEITAVADFKQRAVEVCKKSDRYRGEYFAGLIESLPLIGEKK